MTLQFSTPHASYEGAPIASLVPCTTDPDLTLTEDAFGDLIATAIFSQLAAEPTIMVEAL